jgi:acetoin utilization deacetylase AcuC-like enzyme
VTILNPTASDRNEYLKNVQNDLAQTDADMIAVSAGFDNHEADWGGLLKTEDYKYMGKLVRDAARRNNGGCFGILEGGYNHSVLGKNVLAFIQGLEEAGYSLNRIPKFQPVKNILYIYRLNQKKYRKRKSSTFTPPTLFYFSSRYYFSGKLNIS